MLHVARTTRRAALLSVLLLDVLALIWLGRRAGSWLDIDWHHLGPWLSSTPLVDQVAAAVRMMALTCMIWLLATSLLYAIATATQIPGALRIADVITLPAVRRMVDRALVLALTASTVVGPSTVAASAAGAHRAPVILKLAATPSPTPAPPLPTPPAPSPTPTPTPSPPPTPGYVPTPAGPGPGPSSPSTQPTPTKPSTAWTTHRVVPGDNLWKISAEHLADALGLDPPHISNRRIASYWLRVVSVNRASLRSGDPDLIYPGEVVRLPPIVQRSEGGG